MTRTKQQPRLTQARFTMLVQMLREQRRNERQAGGVIDVTPAVMEQFGVERVDAESLLARTRQRLGERDCSSPSFHAHSKLLND